MMPLISVSTLTESLLGLKHPPAPTPYGPVARLSPWTGGLSTETFFNGSIDEVRIWDFPLNAKQIVGGLNCQISGQEEDLLAYWDFNQGVAGGDNFEEMTLLDRINANRNGILQSFSLSGSDSN